jgi:hypothetical protein
MSFSDHAEPARPVAPERLALAAVRHASRDPAWSLAGREILSDQHLGGACPLHFSHEFAAYSAALAHRV